MIHIIDARNVTAVADLKFMMQTEWFMNYSPETRPEITSQAAYDMFDAAPGRMKIQRSECPAQAGDMESQRIADRTQYPDHGGNDNVR